MKKRRSWVVVNLVFPMVPFLIEGSIRFVGSEFKIAVETFSACTLAISVSIICLFVSASISRADRANLNEVDLEDLQGTATWFNIYAIALVAAFTVVTLLLSIQEFKHLSFEGMLKPVMIAIDLFVIIPFIHAFLAQQSFKLKVTL